MKEEFEGQAEWRREKAEEYPEDPRNQGAAELFDTLAATADAIPQAVLVAYGALDMADHPELWGDHLRAVGFHELSRERHSSLGTLSRRSRIRANASRRYGVTH